MKIINEQVQAQKKRHVEDYQEKVIEGILISGYLLFNWSIHAQAKGKVDIIISGLTSTMYLASLGV